MSNASQSANAALRRYNQPGHALRIDARNERGVLHERSTEAHGPAELAAKSLTATMSATGRADTIWQLVHWYFLEGFTLYGASLHWVATTAVTAIASKVNSQQRQKPTQSEQRKSVSLVSPAARAETAHEGEGGVNQTAFGTRMLSTRDGLASPSLDVDRYRFVHPGWLAMIWRGIARWWTKRRREREINDAVDALAEYDDRMLRDIGIPHRSQIEQIVRHGRDC